MSRSHDYLDVQPRSRTAVAGRAAPRVGGLYDRFVAVMRMILPAIALGIGVLLLAWPLLNPSEFSFILAIDKVRLSPERLRMVKPRYYGTDSHNRPFIIEADSALQESGQRERVSLTTIHAQLELDTGVEVAARAAEGVYYPEKKQLGLEGDVVIETSDGYVVEASDAVIDIETRRVTSERRVSGAGPMGEFSAQGFDAKLDQDTLGFNNDVSARLHPRKIRAAPKEDGTQ